MFRQIVQFQVIKNLLKNSKTKWKNFGWSKLSNFESENSIDWKRFGNFISLHLAYWRKSVCFCSFYEAKHFKKKKKNAQNQRAKLIFWKWVKLLLYNSELFQQVFENLKLNKLAKEDRRLDLEDRIWRLKFWKTQFWSCILKNEFESSYFSRGAQVGKSSLLEVNS